MAESWHTLGGRLRWAIERQPSQGRQRGLRLFQRRMEEHGPDVPGTSLTAVQGYLRGDGAEPAPTFLALAARLLNVRRAWLTWGDGAPTEEEEASRREAPERELLELSVAVYAALGVPTTIAAGVPTRGQHDATEEERERFHRPAVWAPAVRQLVLRLYQHRPSWDLLAGREKGYQPQGSILAGQERDPLEADEAYWCALKDTARAIAAPLRELGVDSRHLRLNDVADYVQAISLTLHRIIHQYVPDDEAKPVDALISPLTAALLSGLTVSKGSDEEGA